MSFHVLNGDMTSVLYRDGWIEVEPAWNHEVEDDAIAMWRSDDPQLRKDRAR
jgi:hypothetical protein